MSHFIIKCQVCSDVISQCRCWSNDKPVKYEVCAKCNGATKMKDKSFEELRDFVYFKDREQDTVGISSEFQSREGFEKWISAHNRMFPNAERFDLVEKKACEKLFLQRHPVVLGLVEALKHADAAMTYAFDDYGDQYYNNVNEIIQKAKKAYESAKGEK